MKRMLYLATTLILLIAAFSLFISTSLSWDPLPIPTIPHITAFPLDYIVNIPDSNLRHELHLITSVPEIEDIHRSDLAALTGNLSLANKNIFNAEGIQYCVNIATLDMGRNNLSSMPTSMSGMDDLTTLYLHSNSFTSIPSSIYAIPNLRNLCMDDNPITNIPADIASMPDLKGIQMRGCELTSFPTSLLSTSLSSLDLSNNDLGSIPSNINNMDYLTSLNLSGTGISSLPANLYLMNHIAYLYLLDNNISSISSSISGMSSLYNLDVSYNKLESLPASICALPNLTYLNAGFNNLYSLPSDIGHSNIRDLYVSGNRIGSLPRSIGESTYLQTLDATINRLTSLPSNLNDIHYTYINIEWNYIDMSSGSSARALMDGLSAATKVYMHQLKPIPDITAEATPNSISLSWQPGENGDDGVSVWTVTGYVVYVIVDDEMVKLSDLSDSTLEYTHTDLTPETEYEYRIGVNYHIIIPCYETDTRCYTIINASTLAVETPTPAETSAAPSESSTLTISPLPTNVTVTSSTTDTVSITDIEETKGAQQGPPVWVIIVFCILGAVILGTGITLVIILRKKQGKIEKNES